MKWHKTIERNARRLKKRILDAEEQHSILKILNNYWSGTGVLSPVFIWPVQDASFDKLLNNVIQYYVEQEDANDLLCAEFLIASFLVSAQKWTWQSGSEKLREILHIMAYVQKLQDEHRAFDHRSKVIRLLIDPVTNRKVMGLSELFGTLCKNASAIQRVPNLKHKETSSSYAGICLLLFRSKKSLIWRGKRKAFHGEMILAESIYELSMGQFAFSSNPIPEYCRSVMYLWCIFLLAEENILTSALPELWRSLFGELSPPEYEREKPIERGIVYKLAYACQELEEIYNFKHKDLLAYERKEFKFPSRREISEKLEANALCH